MGLRKTVLENTRTLTESDRKIVDILMRDIREAAFLPAASVASMAQVHESTVVRLAQKLGYAGYSEMRDAMRADVRELNDGKSRLVKLNDERKYDLGSLVVAEAQALMRLPDHLSQASLDEAAQLLLDANHIFIYGNHYAIPLVTFLDRRLRLLGFRTSPLAADSRELAERASSLGSGDLIFAFALRREPAGLLPLLSKAQERGATSIVLTDVHGLALDPSPTKLLLAPRGLDEDFRTQVVPHLVCYALQLSMYHLAPERCEAALSSVDDLNRVIEPETRRKLRPRMNHTSPVPQSEIKK
ncbi:MurR/RpiR family transcriptional regulator [Paenarthrobacter sp. NPDC089989]|uniref:MurR/RpiR family transcriptional regulator n=1 Tax=unclassified Paenarthrobacter TaxID=2634190 RepID=UPI0037F2EAC9